MYDVIIFNSDSDALACEERNKKTKLQAIDVDPRFTEPADQPADVRGSSQEQPADAVQDTSTYAWKLPFQETLQEGDYNYAIDLFLEAFKATNEQKKTIWKHERPNLSSLLDPPTTPEPKRNEPYLLNNTALIPLTIIIWPNNDQTAEASPWDDQNFPKLQF
ncbi:6054_t:CDS:2 [Ambispora gerdemannii]|uniref:6054_t:CDS:1 n=1 Tax=Ambispora gerdemannii TaxID=144530 RepID=A0A9N9AGN5_9GLOM|nr:6054_t:CDS:2 [Ambispora gerdemannii]